MSASTSSSGSVSVGQYPFNSPDNTGTSSEKGTTAPESNLTGTELEEEEAADLAHAAEKEARPLGEVPRTPNTGPLGRIP